ncbi:hypothetical protein WA158_001073 [Blastocystis sp. Blastoise]
MFAALSDISGILVDSALYLSIHKYFVILTDLLFWFGLIFLCGLNLTDFVNNIMKRFFLPVTLGMVSDILFINIFSNLGATALGGVAYYNMRFPPDRDQYINSLDDPTPVEMATFTPKQLKSHNALYNRTVSRLTGLACKVHIPISMRKSIYTYVAEKLNINTNEMKGSFEDYQTPGEFFTRSLKEGVRPICENPNAIVSPVDGRIVSVYRNDPLDKNIQVNQVKGIRYSLKDFFGFLPAETVVRAENSEVDDPRYLYSVVIYLSPSDYHRVHTPVQFDVKERLHYPGYVLPVKESYMTRVKNLLAINERVCLKGDWMHGFFSLSFIGAYNVGSITLPFENGFKTNKFGQHPNKRVCYDKIYDTPISLKRGEQAGQFNLGSTVVLIFESPEFDFVVKPGEKVQLGQPLGRIVSAKERIPDHEDNLYSYLGYDKEVESYVTKYFQGSISKSELEKEVEKVKQMKLMKQKEEEEAKQKIIEEQRRIEAEQEAIRIAEEEARILKEKEEAALQEIPSIPQDNTVTIPSTESTPSSWSFYLSRPFGIKSKSIW